MGWDETPHPFPTVAPLKLMSGLIILPQTLLGTWLLFHVYIKFKPYQSKGFKASMIFLQKRMSTSPHLLARQRQAPETLLGSIIKLSEMFNSSSLCYWRINYLHVSKMMTDQFHLSYVCRILVARWKLVCAKHDDQHYLEENGNVLVLWVILMNTVFFIRWNFFHCYNIVNHEQQFQSSYESFAKVSCHTFIFLCCELLFYNIALVEKYHLVVQQNTNCSILCKGAPVLWRSRTA